MVESRTGGLKYLDEKAAGAFPFLQLQSQDNFIRPEGYHHRKTLKNTHKTHYS